jgi:hypothetical protein
MKPLSVIVGPETLPDNLRLLLVNTRENALTHGVVRQ